MTSSGEGGEKQAFRETRVVSPVLCDCNKVLHLDLCPVSSWERGGGRGLGVQEERGCQGRTQGMNLSAYFSLLGLSQLVPQTGSLSNRILLAPSSGGRENKIKGLGAVSSSLFCRRPSSPWVFTLRVSVLISSHKYTSHIGLGPT